MTVHGRRKLAHTCFCLLGPQSCTPESVGVCLRLAPFCRHPGTTGTGLSHPPTSPTSSHQGPENTAADHSSLILDRPFVTATVTATFC